jgi:hypothetical protein
LSSPKKPILNIEEYSNLTPEEISSKFDQEFDHIGQQFTPIFLSQTLRCEGVTSARFTSKFRKLFLARRLGKSNQNIIDSLFDRLLE